MGENRSLITAGVGIALLIAAIASDFVINSFWVEHAMLTALLASLLIVVITVAVVNEALDRRNRRRWSLLAQSAMFALVQRAWMTWMGMVEVLELAEVQTGSMDSLAEGWAVALDRGRVSSALDELMLHPQRRYRLRVTVERSSEDASRVISTGARARSSAVAERNPQPSRTTSRSGRPASRADAGERGDRLRRHHGR
jgi:hypothetical protein